VTVGFPKCQVAQAQPDLQGCIYNNDTQALVRLPGVGKKTAERLVIEMRDRLPDLGDSSVSGITAVSSVMSPFISNPKQEAISALCSLGYKSLDASKMVQSIDVEGKSCEDIIRQALQGAAK
jgi:Holliday junction DNA helicase RuvA